MESHLRAPSVSFREWGGALPWGEEPPSSSVRVVAGGGRSLLSSAPCREFYFSIYFIIKIIVLKSGQYNINVLLLSKQYSIKTELLYNKIHKTI